MTASHGSAGSPSPLAQAWRAFEALVIVLALIVGGLYGLKRAGIIQGDGASGAAASAPSTSSFNLSRVLSQALAPKPGAPPLAPAPASSPAAWLGRLESQPLPGAAGASLHLVSVGGRTLLLGATAASVSLIAEMEGAPQAPFVPGLQAMPEVAAPSGFDAFLAQADAAPRRVPNETEMLLNATTMRLQALVARSEATHPHAATNGFGH